MKIIKKGLLAATFIALGQIASAATIQPTAQTALIPGNDQLNGNGPNAATTQAAFDALLTPYFDVVAPYQIAKHNVGGSSSADLNVSLTSGTTGSWTYSGGDTAFVVVYKAADGWIGQYFAGGITGNMFDLADLDGAALSNGGGNVPALSHLSIYGVDGSEINVVPLPAGGLLLLSAFGGVAVYRRRKTAA